MSRRKLVAGLGGLVAVVVIALVALNAPAGMAPHDSMRASLGVKLVVQVHRVNGTTVTYTKEGDLILKNFANILINMLFMGGNDPDNDQNWVNTNGNSGHAVDFNEDSKAQIVLGTGSTAPTLNDYKLGNQVISFDIQDADVTINGTDMVIDVFGSYTADNAYNITEVGLLTLQNNHGRALIFHDVLPNPIQLNAGDGITVHYYIFLNNP